MNSLTGEVHFHSKELGVAGSMDEGFILKRTKIIVNFILCLATFLL